MLTMLQQVILKYFIIPKTRAFCISQMLGFNIKFVQPEDGAWGKDMGNLTWNGMVGMLQRWVLKIILFIKDSTHCSRPIFDFGGQQKFNQNLNIQERG